MNYNPHQLASDPWDPNMLAASNWLEPIDFQGVSQFLDMYGNAAAADVGSAESWAPVMQQSVYQQGSNILQPTSPMAIGSAVSPVSTESAADVVDAQDRANQQEGQFYVDGETARLPKTKRRRLSTRLTVRPTNSTTKSIFSLESPAIDAVDLHPRIAIPDYPYQQIVEAWQSLCLMQNGPWRTFESSEFPTKTLFEHLLGLYFSSFQGTMPFMHPPTFTAETTDWILILSMASVGACYLPDPDFAISLHEFVRRCLLYHSERADAPPMEVLTLARCRMLNVIGLAYSGNRTHVTYALGMQHVLVSSFHELLKTNDESPAPASQGTEDEWPGWTYNQMIYRTLYALFVLDSMLTYHFQRRPSLRLSDCRVQLPCQEKLWSAKSAASWASMIRDQAPCASLPQTLQHLYVDKRISLEQGEFARIVIIHGLFHRTWEVERYFSDPLSHWEPTAKPQASSEVLPSSPVWPPSNPTVTKFQNSLCDCLDILHWQANATLMQAGSMEHPTVGFLHISRVVMLAPIESIVRLAEGLTELRQLTIETVAKDKLLVKRWAIQGQYKARLAAVHAGALLWHLRQYPIDGFYEAPAIGLAALTLWALGTYSVQQLNGQNAPNPAREVSTANAASSSASTTEEGSAPCGIILLDRPTDDELVQQFIKHGHTMRAYIGGVVDLYGPNGPDKVLHVASKLLESSKCWGVSEAWLDLLQKLIVHVQR
jgi:hypothetical protein